MSDASDIYRQPRDEKWEGLNPPYSTIVADPPWPSTAGPGAPCHDVPTRVGRVIKNRTPEAHYSSMSVTDICALSVGTLAAKDAHLYLWVTNSGLGAGLTVMAAWGFSHKTTLTWVKQGHLGLGYWFRNQTEHILFGVRGSLRTLVNDQRTVFEAPKGGHSVKPPAAYDLIERSSPGPYVDLFCRRPRFGWDSWGLGYESERVS